MKSIFLPRRTQRIRSISLTLLLVLSVCAAVISGFNSNNPAYAEEQVAQNTLNISSLERELDGTYVEWSVGFKHATTGKPAVLRFDVKLTAGQTLVDDPAYWQLFGANTKLATVAEPGKQYSLSYKLNPVGDAATITVTGPFSAGTDYRISFHSIPADLNKPYFDRGVELGASVNQGNATANATNTDIGGAVLNRVIPAGFAAFSVTNLVQGGAAAKIADSTEFTIEGSYILPQNKTISSYPGWKAPGLVNADQTGGKFDLRVGKDKAAALDANFPLGTRIELKQPQHANTDEYHWQTTLFRDKDRTLDSFTLTEQKTFIESVNKVQFKESPGPLWLMLSKIPLVGKFLATLVTSSSSA